MNITPKQISILTVIYNGNDDHLPVDLDQVIERVDYTTTKASIQFSIRALVTGGLIEKVGMEKRRGRQRVLFGLTELGRSMIAQPLGNVLTENEDWAAEGIIYEV